MKDRWQPNYTARLGSHGYPTDYHIGSLHRGHHANCTAWAGRSACSSTCVFKGVRDKAWVFRGLLPPWNVQGCGGLEHTGIAHLDGSTNYRILQLPAQKTKQKAWQTSPGFGGSTFHSREYFYCLDTGDMVWVWHGTGMALQMALLLGPHDTVGPIITYIHIRWERCSVKFTDILNGINMWTPRVLTQGNAICIGELYVLFKNQLRCAATAQRRRSTWPKGSAIQNCPPWDGVCQNHEVGDTLENLSGTPGIKHKQYPRVQVSCTSQAAQILLLSITVTSLLSASSHLWPHGYVPLWPADREEKKPNLVHRWIALVCGCKLKMDCPTLQPQGWP